MRYTIKEMCDTCHITSRTFYRATNQNADFRKMVEETKIETPKGSTYGESVLDWLKKKYLPDAEEQETPTMPVEPPSSPTEPSDGVECINSPSETRSALEREIDGFTAKVEKLELENAFLREQVAALKEDKKVLNEQFSNTLLLFTQEKQEKQLLLPAPKKPLGEKVKNWLKTKGLTH